MTDEELNMLFLLEHFSLEDLVEAENKYCELIASDTDNLVDYEDDDEYANTTDTDLGYYTEDGEYYLY